jgi:tRNA-specific 2-thiouridylase
VPHYVLNLESAFGRDVVDDFVQEYARGRTPIPCVNCNTFTKFRDLVRTADRIGAQWIATGHYAQVLDGRLVRGRDDAKDQTYFLWGIDRAVLSRMLLPVGASTKPETRAAARRLGLEVIAEKTESMDICFVPDGDHTKIIAQSLGADAAPLAPGPIVLEDGTHIGMHDGYARFTIGQRRGLPGGSAEPLFVVGIRPDDRAVIVGPRSALLGRGVIARGMNWLVEPLTVGARVLVRVRHRAPLVPAELVRVDGTEVELALDAPVSAITPGQSLVLYDGDVVVGGGFIEAGLRTARRQLPVIAA